MPIKYIGRTTDFRGKPLWEILGNLKNFGVGRIVVRSMFERYDEPCYFVIRKVEAMPNEETRKVCVWAEKIFRGRKYPYLVKISSVTYKADYRLIHKHEECAYTHAQNAESSEKPARLLPRTAPFPPLLKELIIRDCLARGEKVTEEPRMPLVCNQGVDNVSVVAKESEKPTVSIDRLFGVTKSQTLYSNIEK
ncbi:28S ribosomal protein S34, mitochondrial [Schistocerca serialis cubense]|uniref:28S ribosomal protein S34, mitochondrial n=1 Tax=Schistocerca serialis cubense TaxID=2023355 RepID=UPI00214E52F7|nr:28S ribosomal protein S34, mitochondrial [Schistocerca serialis cubense]